MATQSPAPISPDDQSEAAGERRLTSRQRRIEEQRKKIETMRRGQRRKRAIWGTGILAVFAAVAALVMTQIKPPTAAQGQQFPDEGAGHVAVGTPLTYRTNPPTSGAHYDQAAGYQVYDREVDPGNWVHSLEHGAVAVLYNPDKCNADCVSQLRSIWQAAPNDRTFNLKKMLVTPYSKLDTAVAVAAWRWSDKMDAPDRERILAFYRDHVGRGPENVP